MPDNNKSMDDNDNKITTSKTDDNTNTDEEKDEKKKTKKGESKAGGPGMLDKVSGWSTITNSTDNPNPKSNNKEERDRPASVTKNTKNSSHSQRTKIGALFSALQNDNVLTIASDQLKASQENNAPSSNSNPDYIHNKDQADQKAKKERKEHCVKVSSILNIFSFGAFFYLYLLLTVRRPTILNIV